MSMTTELAQRMKAAAIRAKAAIEDFVANRMSMSVCLSECAEFNDLSDGPDNIIALVEALEKENAYASAYEAEKWHYHGLAESEGERANRAEARLEEAEKRIAELEARTVKLPKPISVLHRRDFNDAHRAIYAYPEAEVNAALAAAGVAVEGE